MNANKTESDQHITVYKTTQQNNKEHEINSRKETSTTMNTTWGKFDVRRQIKIVNTKQKNSIRDDEIPFVSEINEPNDLKFHKKCIIQI